MKISDYKNTDIFRKSTTGHSRFIVISKRCKYRNPKNKMYKMTVSTKLFFMHFYFNADINCFRRFIKYGQELHRYIGVSRRL